MSLINDALKKAQDGNNRQRAETMLGGGGHAVHRQENGPFRIILVIVLVIGFAGWGVALLFMFMKDDPSVEVAMAPVQVEVIPVAEKVDSTELEKSDEVPVLEETPVIQTIQEDPTVRQEPKEVAESVTPAIQFNKPEEEPALNTANLKTVLMLEISAVMGSGKKCRIVVAGRIVRYGELIDYDKDIRFMGKKGSTLFFKDSAEQVYEKHLL